MQYPRIKNLRIDHDLTQKEVAKYLNITQTTYSKYERGILNYPVDIIVKLADFYGVSTDYLLNRTPYKYTYVENKEPK